ncbi:MAG: leucine-rich repeat protein [Bacteroidales bacterium]
MKKILLLVSAIALTTSCTKTELGKEVPNTPVKGIGFEVQTGGDTKAQFVDGARKTIWYAEQDQIGILYKNAYKKGASATFEANKWVNVSNQAIYKATTSGSRGFFASNETDEYLEWAKDGDVYRKASFRAYWPKVALTATAPNVVLIPQLSEQNQSNMVGAETVNYNFMTAETLDVTPKESYNSVGETANLKFVSQFATATFAIKNAKATFGMLKSITLTADATKNTTVTTSSILATGDALGTYDFETKKLTNGSAAASAITLTFNSTTGLDPIKAWSNDALAYMSILPVDRAKFVEAKETETISVKYTFANTSYTKEIKTSESWPAGRLLSFNEKYPMDFDAIPAYYVKNSSGDYYVYLNSGSFSGLQDPKDETKLLVNGEEIAKTAVKGIYSKVALTLSDLGTMKKYTALEEIELAENTMIPAKTFTQATLTSIVMPKVSDIDAKGFIQQTAPVVVMLPSYGFKNKEITSLILVPASLKTLDMSSVERVGDIFPAAGITLNGFDALTNVTVKSGVLLGSGSFKGCTTLAKVNFPVVGGSVQLVGSEVFSGATVLASIAISNVEIPVSSFEGCEKLASVVTGSGKAIQPTKIYKNAFKGTALVDIDLSQATVINESAFENCTKLVGAKDAIRPSINVLYVNGITKLEDKVFSGCTSLKYVSFANVTEVGTDMFATSGANTPALNEIEFLKPFTSTTIADKSFGTITGTTLFVPASQTGVSGAILTMNKKNFTFSKITTSL